MPVSLRVAKPAPASAQSFRTLEQQVHQFVNRERRAAGIPQLAWSEPLAAEARRHGKNMASRKFFAHVDPSRGDVASRLDQSGIPWLRCAENLYEQKGGGRYASQALRAWLHSPTHRRNIFDPKLKEAGVGAALRPDGTVIIVQEFTLSPDSSQRHSS